MKKATFVITIPTLKKALDGSIVRQEDREMFYALPACVVNKSVFQADVQRYVDIALAEKYDWQAFSIKRKKNPDDVSLVNAELYAELYTELMPAPENRVFTLSLASCIAFCICKDMQTDYYVENNTPKRRACTLGCGMLNLYETYVEHAGTIISDKKATELTNMLRDWFKGVIDADDSTKAWKTDSITRAIALELICQAGRINDSLKKDGISGKRDGISKFTEQALLKCLKKCCKFADAPMEDCKVLG